MKKKLSMLFASVVMLGILVVVKPAEVKAIAPCSYPIIDQANAQIAATTVEYQAAQQREAAALANLNAIKAAGGSALDVTVAANAYATAQQATRWHLDQVNNAKAFLKNITDRANLETALEEDLDQLHNLTNMQCSLTECQSAQGVATNIAERLKALQASVVAYQQAAAVNPGLQPLVDQLNAQIVSLQAEYAAKQAIADQKFAAYQAAVAADHYDQYSPDIINYWRAREMSRTHAKCCDCSYCKILRGEKY